MTTRRDFVGGALAFGVAAGCKTVDGAVGGGELLAAEERPTSRYAVSILGDTHYDAEPESVYHSHYDETNKWAKIQHQEFVRNGEMWRTR